VQVTLTADWGRRPGSTGVWRRLPSVSLLSQNMSQASLTSYAFRSVRRQLGLPSLHVR
jgi:hypothetical protein